MQYPYAFVLKRCELSSVRCPHIFVNWRPQADNSHVFRMLRGSDNGVISSRIILGLWLIGWQLTSCFMPSSLIILPDLHIGYVRLALNYRLSMIQRGL